MKLYYLPGACSLAVHIALNEIGATFDTDQVDTKTGRTAGGADYTAINPKGYVPALALDDGTVLTEGPAILQYVADSKPELGLAPAAGTLERVRLQEMLNYLSAELHKSFSPLFAQPALKGAAREQAMAKLNRRMGYIDNLLADGRAYLLGKSLSVADILAFVISSWTKPLGIGLDRWPHVAAFAQRIGDRPAVIAALKREGLAH